MRCVPLCLQEGADDSSSKPLPLDATAWHDLALLLSRKRDRIDTLRVSSIDVVCGDDDDHRHHMMVDVWLGVLTL